MKFTWSTLMVKDLDETIRFYEEVIGWRVSSRFPAGPGMEIAFMGDGETRLEFIRDEKQDEIRTGPDISWGFTVDSVEDMMQFVKEKGIGIHSGPFTTGGGSKYFYILDPNGMKLQFFED
jgi:lactoylglutathione lyase